MANLNLFSKVTADGAGDLSFHPNHSVAGSYVDTAPSTPSALRATSHIYLTTGSRLLSTEGRVMLTIIADTCGRHDTLGGACAAESNTVRYASEKHSMHNCRDNFLLALAGVGDGHDQARPHQQHQLLHERAGDPGGRADLRRRHLGAGKYVEMRAEMDVIVLDLQLPAAQQPVQCLQPHAGAHAGLGLRACEEIVASGPGTTPTAATPTREDPPHAPAQGAE